MQGLISRALPVLAAVLFAVPAWAQEAPDALVKRVSQEVLTIVKSDPKVRAGDQARIRETALAMGRNWSKATPEQQAQLAEQFKTLLVRTYSSAITTYKDETIEYKPLRMDAGASDVIVRTQVNRANGAPVPIDYSLAKGADGNWKAYDVIVRGVSLVPNYRDEFNDQIKAGGVDGLIKKLQSKNSGGAA